MLASISAYTISIWIHVSAAVIGFGATFAGAVAFTLAARKYPRHLPFVHHLSLAINRRLATPALVVVLITGFYQVSKGNWSMGSFWISATLVILIVLGVIMLGIENFSVMITLKFDSFSVVTFDNRFRTA